MTVPVINIYKHDKDEKTMAFFVPTKLSKNVPLPKSEDVFIIDMPELTVATISFGGNAVYVIGPLIRS
jgi:hypothetical protein